MVGVWQAGGSTKNSEQWLLAKKVWPKANTVGNKTSTQNSCLGGSNVEGDALLFMAIYNQEQQEQRLLHPDFKLPETIWVDLWTKSVFRPMLFHN
jgi:hypothetical protein